MCDMQVEKALGVHCLAMRAGVEWLGDLPEPATALIVEDTDGDRQPGNLVVLNIFYVQQKQQSGWWMLNDG
eukprot:Skav214189  [mRNA]  locus=scaffold3641:81301:81513:+ [translate_table: standard]